jgi:hypothetical protein
MDDATGPLGVFVAAGRKRGALVPDDGTLLALLGQHAALLLRAAGQTSRHLAAAGRLSKLLRGAPRMCASGVQLEAVAARTLPCELPILMVAGPAPTGAEARPARRRERGGVASPTAVAAGGRAGPGLPASGPAWEELEKLVQGL